MLSETLLDAEVRLGEMTKTIPKMPGKRLDLEPSDSGVVRSATMHEVITGLGFTPK